MSSLSAGSLFSGIGGLDLGLARAGFRHSFFCESDPYRRDVLRARWPGVPVHEDVRDVRLAEGNSRAVGQAGHDAPVSGRVDPVEHVTGAGAVDLLCGGFPCQDLSVAGQRRGLMHQGGRSNLFFEFARIAESLRPRWVLVENVPGLLSSNGGRDFGTVLGTLADVGYGVAWRVLDSRFFGVPQRRRRVFVLGALFDGDPRAAAERAGEVLAVGSRCPGHPATRGEAREDVAVASLSGLGSGGPDDNDGQAGRVIAFHNTQDPISDQDVSMPIGRKTFGMGVAFSENQRAEVLETPIARQLTSGGGKPGQGYSAVRQDTSVRRLTPTECERLQGLPDGWTDLGGTADSKRYAALGDAVTVNVAEWIGRRLARSDSNWDTRHDN